METDSARSGSTKAHPPANDALLAQLVRGALGRSGRGTSGINVSSCSFVVTLHGSVGSVRERDEIVEIARSVPGSEGVVDKLKVIQADAPPAVSEGTIQGISVFREKHSARMEVTNGEQENEGRQSWREARGEGGSQGG